MSPDIIVNPKKCNKNTPILFTAHDTFLD